MLVFHLQPTTVTNVPPSMNSSGTMFLSLSRNIDFFTPYREKFLSVLKIFSLVWLFDEFHSYEQ